MQGHYSRVHLIVCEKKNFMKAGFQYFLNAEYIFQENKKRIIKKKKSKEKTVEIKKLQNFVNVRRDCQPLYLISHFPTGVMSILSETEE